MQNIGRSQPMQANVATSQRNELLKTQDNLDLKEFWKTLARRKGLVLGITLTTILLALLFTFLSTPEYRSTASLRIERDSAKVFDSGADFSGVGDIRDTRDFYETQFELLRSRSLMAQVIKELNLDASAVSPSLFGRIKAAILPKNEGDQQSALIDNLLDNLTIEPVRNSRVVNVSVDTPNPELSAKIANSIVSNFVSSNQNTRSNLSQEAKVALENKRNDAKTKLEDSERKVNEYSRVNGILGTDDSYETQSTTLNLMVSKLSEQIVQAESNRISIETSGKATKAEIDAARDHVNLLREELSTRQGELLQQQTKMVEYKTLQREVKNNQEVFQTMLKRLEEVDIAGSMASNNLSIVDKAEVPQQKYKPNLGTNLAFATLLGLLIGVAAAFMKEFMYDGIKNVSDLEQMTGLPILAAIPASKNGTNANRIARYVVSDPKSSIAEAFRSLRTTLQFSTPSSKTGAQIIYVTSACANEGKTTTASNLALAYANTGVKVLLVDADLRNPSFAEALGVNAKSGLADYLQDKIEMDQIVHSTSTNNLHIITAGEPPQDPVELLSSKRMQLLLDQARNIFEVVILDGPPVLGLADSLLLSSLADVTLLTINSRDTKVGAIQNSIKRLKQANGNLVGIVLNKVDTTGRLGYDYDYYYYKNDKVKA